MLATTQVVVARPTPSAPPVMRRPQWQPIRPMIQAKTTLLVSPVITSSTLSAEMVWLM